MTRRDPLAGKRCRRCGAGPIGNCGYYGAEIPREQCPLKPTATKPLSGE